LLQHVAFRVTGLLPAFRRVSCVRALVWVLTCSWRRQRRRRRRRQKEPADLAFPSIFMQNVQSAAALAALKTARKNRAPFSKRGPFN